MKAQEIFDISAKHLLTQNERAAVDNYSCSYRGPHGTKCAIGCLITDRMYRESMEDKSVAILIEDYPGIKRKFGVRNLLLLNALQDCHDDCPVENWWEELGDIAERFDLDPGVLKMGVK